MPPPKLHHFDLALCDYVRGNIRALIRGAGEAPQVAAAFTPLTPSSSTPHGNRRVDPRSRYKDLPPPDAVMLWLSEQLQPRSFNYIRADEAPCLLSDDHFEELACVLEDGQLVVPLGRWVPWPQLHADYAHCLPEIRMRLATEVAEQFACDSARNAAALNQEELKIWEGVRIVGRWVSAKGGIRDLLRAMALTDWLPKPEGKQPTPDYPMEIPPHLLKIIERARAAFKKNGGLRRESTKVVRRTVTGKAKDVLEALRYLKQMGEYQGTE